MPLPTIINYPAIFKETPDSMDKFEKLFFKLHKIYSKLNKFEDDKSKYPLYYENNKSDMDSTFNEYLKLQNEEEFKNYFVETKNPLLARPFNVLCDKASRSRNESSKLMIALSTILHIQFLQTDKLFNEFIDHSISKGGHAAYSLVFTRNPDYDKTKKVIERIIKNSDSMINECLSFKKISFSGFAGKDVGFDKAEAESLAKDSLKNTNARESLNNLKEIIEKRFDEKRAAKTTSGVTITPATFSGKSHSELLVFLRGNYYVFDNFCEKNKELCNSGNALKGLDLDELKEIAKKLSEDENINKDKFEEFMDDKILASGKNAFKNTTNKIFEDLLKELNNKKRSIYYHYKEIKKDATKQGASQNSKDDFKEIYQNLEESIEKYITDKNRNPNYEEFEKMLIEELNSFYEGDFKNYVTEEEIEDIYEKITEEANPMINNKKYTFYKTLSADKDDELKEKIMDILNKYVKDKIKIKKILKTNEVTANMITQLENELTRLEALAPPRSTTLPPTITNPTPPPSAVQPPPPPARTRRTRQQQRASGGSIKNRRRKTMRKGRKGSKKTRRH